MKTQSQGPTEEHLELKWAPCLNMSKEHHHQLSARLPFPDTLEIPFHRIYPTALCPFRAKKE